MGLRRKNNALQFLEDKTSDYAERVALGIKTQLGWNEFTYSGLGMLSRKVGHYLINDLQIAKGERLAILSESMPEYGACLFGSVLAGLVTVPLDIKLTEYELQSILSDCEPTVLMVSKALADKAKKLQTMVPSIKTILLMNEPSCTDDFTSIHMLPEKYNCKWRHRSSKSTALIIYTSGTTGAPKGVEITFKNMFAQLFGVEKALDSILGSEVITGKKQISVLSILPMNHLFEMTVGFSIFLSLGFSIFYAKSLKPKDILGIMREKRVEFMIVVPAFLKLLKTGIETELAAAPKVVRAIFNIMFNIAKVIPCYGLKK